MPKSLQLLALLAACTSQPRVDRPAELASCQLISKSGDELARCLVLKYSWRAENAGPAKAQWQWQLDSIRRDHEVQAALVLAAQQLAADSLRRARERRDAIAAARKDSLERWIDSTYNDCVTAAVAWWQKQKMDSFTDDFAAFKKRRDPCDSTHNRLRRRAGLDPLPPQ